MKTVRLDSEAAREAMKDWSLEDLRDACLDCLLFGNVYVGPDGEYVPAASIDNPYMDHSCPEPHSCDDDRCWP